MSEKEQVEFRILTEERRLLLTGNMLIELIVTSSVGVLHSPITRGTRAARLTCNPRILIFHCFFRIQFMTLIFLLLFVGKQGEPKLRVKQEKL